jgi:hypothetical protein
MPTIKPADYVILAVLAAVAAAPIVISWARKLIAGGLTLPFPKPVIHSEDSWRKAWVQKLMELQDDLDSKPEQAEALKLCRQLIWQLLGGGPTK